MNPLLTSSLIAHIFLGLAAISFFVAVFLNLMTVRPNLRSLKVNSFLGLLSFLGSWIASGYYYVAYYGKAVKPIIKAGHYPWVHNILMETKEHIFLFLPFLSVAVVAIIWLHGSQLENEPRLKRVVTVLTLTIVILGIIITFAGMAISGAVGKKT